MPGHTMGRVSEGEGEEEEGPEEEGEAGAEADFS